MNRYTDETKIWLNCGPGDEDDPDDDPYGDSPPGSDSDPYDEESSP